MLQGGGLALTPRDAEVLIAAARLQQALTQMLRIALDETLEIEQATTGLKTLLTRAAEAGSFTETQKRLARHADRHAELTRVFSRILQPGWISVRHTRLSCRARQGSPIAFLRQTGGWTAVAALTATGSLRPAIWTWK